MSEQVEGGFVFLRIFNPKFGTSVSRHMCWDKARFVESQRVARAKENETIEVITEKEFNKENRRGK